VTFTDRIMFLFVLPQIEHHLFPHMSSDKLALLAPTVRDICRDFDVEVSILSFITTLPR
jgi:fatty acid desaturase